MPKRILSEQEIKKIIEHKMANKIPRSKIYETYHLSVATFYYWKNKLGYSSKEHLHKQRMDCVTLQIKCKLMGANKNYLVEDAARRDWELGRMNRHIIDVYYSILSNRPDMQGKEMSEIKKFIIDKIKL